MSSAHNADYFRDTDDAIRRTTLLDRFAARVARAFTAVEDRLDHSIHLHCDRAIPAPRSVSPDEIIEGHRNPRPHMELVGTWPCCDCCTACNDLHRDGCPVHQGGAFA
jgi:hypothetical protein